MSTIMIEKVRNREDAVSVFQRIDALFDEIRRKAFSLFEDRGCISGRDLDDWLTAERETLWSPPLDLIESQEEFLIRVVAPGCEAEDILITATPESIVFQAECGETLPEAAEVRVAELGPKRLYRRVDLPSPIDTDRIKATLEKGILTLSAAKAAPAKEKKIHVAATQAA